VLLQAPVLWVVPEPSGEVSSFEGSERLDICNMQTTITKSSKRFMSSYYSIWNKLWHARMFKGKKHTKINEADSKDFKDRFPNSIY
jgi:hypothetical protein